MTKSFIFPAGLAAILLLSCGAESAFARMYSCEDSSGRVVLRDVPCKRGENSRDPAAPGSAPAPQASQAHAAAPQQPQAITAPQVQELADGMANAMARQDVTAMLGYLAADVVFEVEYRLPQGMRFLRLSKNEYAASLRDRIATMTAVDLPADQKRVVIAPGARYAEFTTTLRETIMVDSKARSGVTRSKSMVEIRAGRPLITLVRAVTTFDAGPEKDSVDSQTGRTREARR